MNRQTQTCGLDSLAAKIRERQTDELCEFSVGPQSEDERVYDVLEDCLELCEDGSFTIEDVAPHAPVITGIWGSVHARVSAMQQEAYAIEWVVDREYANARKLAEVVLSLLGFLSVAGVVAHLREALGLTDPRLKLFAATSLLRLRQPVDPAEIERVAACGEVRILLWDRLRELGIESLMPQRWVAPEKLAASALSRWASCPSELGAPPEDIELMASYPIAIKEETVYLYLFRFREYPKPWVPGEGWMAGIAGPYFNGQQLSSPWSEFDRWDSMSAEEHVVKLFGREDRCLRVPEGVAESENPENGEDR